MKKIFSLFCILYFTLTHTLVSAQPPPNGNPYFYYDNYYPDGTPQGCSQNCAQPGCYPSAPICGTSCGLSVCAIAFAIALVAGVAVLIVHLSSDSSNVHQPNL